MEKIAIKNPHAALALNWLDDDCGYGLLVERAIQLGEISLANRYTTRKRAERSTVRWAISCSERLEQSSMKASPQGNQLHLRIRTGLARPAPGKFERPFVRLSA